MNKSLKTIIFASLISLIVVSVLFINYIYKSKNTIIINSKNYIEVLEDAHNNIDMYVGKKIIVSGYVYLEEGFDDNHFVIAKNLAIDSNFPDEALVVGFLCSNKSNYSFSSNETIEIYGTIKKGYYNELEYPIIEFKHFKFLPYIQK